MSSPEEKVFETKNFSYTPPTPVEGLTAEIAFAGLGLPEDFEDVDVSGKIALVQSGLRGKLTEPCPNRYGKSTNEALQTKRLVCVPIYLLNS